MSTSRHLMSHLSRSILALGATLTLGLAGAPRAEAADFTIKIGTLATKSGPHGKVFATWAKAVAEKSGGRLELQFFFNGQQGDEGAMVAKVKSGQLAGAAVSGVGLGKVYKPIAALQMPGLFSSWSKLDAARDALSAELMKGASDAGFTVLGWYDIGRVRGFGKGVAVRLPESLRGQKALQWRDDPIAPVFYQTLGGITPVQLNIPEVLPNLNTGALNALFASPLEAEQLQWASKLDHLSAEVESFHIAGLVVSSKVLDSLPADLKTILVDTAKVTTSALKTRIRSEDDAAFGRLKSKMTLVTRSASERGAWKAFYKKVRARLGQGTFAPELVTRLEELGG
ncbi:MAG TPA: TRAP transporter substrate-binding protein DctP [Myxococcota bacterium]|nr:TRAP transporter substrate-binding protein DctP [Myxococcota bacterium]